MTKAVFRLSLIAVLTLSVYAQTQIRTGVDLVVVPVTVRGEDGKLFAGLMKEDFVVLEDDKPQTITGFDVDPQPLSAAIVVDDGMTATQLNWLYPKGGTPILYTLATSFNADDRMIPYRYDGKVFRLGDFSSDPAAIVKSFDVLQEIAKTRLEAPRDLLGEKGPKFLRSILNLLGAGHTAALKPRASGHMHDAIHEAALALQAESEGRRKMIVIISDGQVIGRNDFSFEQATALLLKEQIQVYGISADFGTFGSFRMLTNYATVSGGDVFGGTSTKTLESTFGQVTEQARNQYALSYVSSNRVGRVPVFRTITVKTRDPKYKVIHRQGYLQMPVQ